MTKPDAILVCPTVPLRFMPANEVDVVRRFLFQNMAGMSEQDNKRWKRMWGEMFKAEAGEGFQLYICEERSGVFHRRHRAILEKLFASQEQFTLVEKLHDWLKVGSGFVEWKPGRDHKPVPIPRSTSFELCSENEIREFHADMVDFLHRSSAQDVLWPSVSASHRPEMLEAVLQSQEADK